MSNVYNFKTGQQVTAEQRRADREAHAARTASELDRAVQRLRDSKVPKGLRAQLAWNLGTIATARAEEQGLTVLALLRQAWAAAATGIPVYGRRKRLVRFSDKELKDPEPYVSNGQHYLSLAEAFLKQFPSSRLPPTEDRVRVLHQLLANAGEFDPDPTREALGAIDGRAASRAALARVRVLLLQACPSLPAYFSTVASQRLRARLLTWEEWEATEDGKLVGSGQAADQLMFASDSFEPEPEALEQIQRGELAPERLHDGFFLNNAVAGVAATWPRVTLGRIVLVRRMAVGSGQASWILQLALAPMGATRPDMLRLVLMAHPDGLTSDALELEYMQLTEFWRGSEPYDTLALSEASVWSVESGEAERWLGLKLTPEQYLSHALADPRTPTVALFEPAFTAPGDFADSASNTVGGMIERNLLFAREDDTISAQLVRDAEQRVTALGVYLDEATRRYNASKRPFFGEDKTHLDKGL